MMMKAFRLSCFALVATGLGLAATTARAADIAGVHLPNHTDVSGTELTLNGVALRTATILHLPVYVASLYLGQPTHDARQIELSSEPKLFRFVFLRDIGVDKVRNAWRHSIAQSCGSPCPIPTQEIDQFINRLPPVQKGDVADVTFGASGVDFMMNGRSLGQISDPTFVRAILLGYVGPNASSPNVRDGLLGMN